MVTSPCDKKILLWDGKHQSNKQTSQMFIRLVFWKVIINIILEILWIVSEELTPSTLKYDIFIIDKNRIHCDDSYVKLITWFFLYIDGTKNMIIP